jgi:Tfp pilus assembly protein PilF
LLLAALVFFPGPLPTAAQSRQSLFSDGVAIEGQVCSFDGGAVTEDYSIQLVGLGDSKLRGSVTAETESGRFSVSGIPQGEYELTVRDGANRAVSQEVLWAGSGSNLVTVRLPEGVHSDRPVSGVVSVRNLRHKVPSRALKEFRKAEAEARKNRAAESIAHLKQALEIDPAFTAAYNNLGIRYMEQGDFANAIPEFQKALALDDTSAPANTNLGLACYVVKRCPEAEQYARRSVKLDSTSNKARYVLGLVLYAEGRDDAGAFENLKAAAREFPKARLPLAELLEQQGRREQAAGEVRAYLKSPKVADRTALEGWLARLERAGTASAPPPGDGN